jgi:hypothetical protein
MDFRLTFFLLSLLLALAGCQGIDQGVRPTHKPSAEHASERPPRSHRDAKTRPSTPQKQPPQEESATAITGTFILYISNQSMILSPVDVRVFIDGRPVVNGNFDLRRQQNWQKFPLTLTPGSHELLVESDRGGATLTRTITLQERQWGVINFWCRQEEGKPRSSFTFELRDEPFYFDRND